MKLLYKYFSPDRCSFIEQRRLKFSNPSDFNDPFEVRVKYINYRKLIEKEFQKRVNEVFFETLRQCPDLSFQDFKAAKKDEIEEERKHLMEKGEQIYLEQQSAIPELLNSDIGILCLSRRCDHILMWSHYADGHKGFVVGFDSNHPFFHDDGKTSLCGDVTYQNELPEIILSSEKKGDTAPLFHKSDVWAYEEEVRLIKKLDSSFEKVNNINLLEIPKDAILEIIFGLQSSDSFQTSCNEMASEFLPNVSVFRMVRVRDEYRIKKELIICVNKV